MKGKGIFLQQIWGVLWGRLIYICERGKDRGGDSFWSSTYWNFWGLEERRFFDRREEKHKGIGEESNCNQGCPGMILATLGILTHTWFFRVFDSWIFNCLVDFCVDEKGHNLFYWEWLVVCLFSQISYFFFGLPFFSMSLISHENNLHLGMFLNLMIAIPPCSW